MWTSKSAYWGDNMAIYNLVMGGGGAAASSWFGDGSNGKLEISSDTPISVAEDTGHIFVQYKSIHIASGGVLRPSHRCAGMVVLCQGDCTIDAGGSINLDKMAPRRSDTTEEIILTSGISAPWLQKISTLVGGAGGKGGTLKSNVAVGRGGLGGNGHRFGGGYGGGGGGGRYYSYGASGVGNDGGDSEPRPPVGITWPYPGSMSDGLYGAGAGYSSATGGAAPGGSGGCEGAYSRDSEDVYRHQGRAGDAYGGGLLLLVVGGELTIAGLVTANAGSGASNTGGNYNGSGGGGGGGGGILAILHRGSLYLSGNVTANGGTAGTGGNTSAVAGSIGTVYVHQVDDELNVVT